MTGVSRLGQVHAGVRHPVQRRPAPLPRNRSNAYARCIVQPAGRPEVDAVVWHSAHRGHRAAPVARRAQVHRGHDHRGLALPAPAVREAGHAALRARRRRRAAANARAHCRAAAARSSGASTSACWPRWWCNRKGVYTELADWARPRGYTHLRVDGDFLPTTGFPRLDRFKEHTIELPVASVKVTAAERRSSCAPQLAKALEHRQGRGACAVGHRHPGGRHGSGAPSQGRAWARCRCSPPSAPARSAPPAMPSWTRACSATTASTAGAPTAWARACKLTKEQRKVYDDSTLAEDNRGRELTLDRPTRSKTWRMPPAPPARARA